MCITSPTTEVKIAMYMTLSSLKSLFFVALKSFFVYSNPEFQLVQPPPILLWASEASAFGRPGSFPQRCVLWGGAPSLPHHRPKLGQQHSQWLLLADTFRGFFWLWGGCCEIEGWIKRDVGHFDDWSFTLRMFSVSLDTWRRSRPPEPRMVFSFWTLRSWLSLF